MEHCSNLVHKPFYQPLHIKQNQRISPHKLTGHNPPKEGRKQRKNKKTQKNPKKQKNKRADRQDNTGTHNKQSNT